VRDLEVNKNYINSWNIFSKLLLIKRLSKNNTQILNGSIVIVQNEKDVQNYIKISNFLNIKICKIENISELVDLTYNQLWTYIVSSDIFELELPDRNHLEKKFIIQIKKGEPISPEDITKQLNEFWYKYSEHGTKSSFKVNWDILSLTSSTWETEFKISFWWNTIEEILSIQRSWDITQNLETLFIWKRENIHDFQITKDFNIELRNKLNSENIFQILDSLDFSGYFDDFNTGLNNYIQFNSLAHIQNKDTQINLWINDLYLEKIEDLKHLLEETLISKKTIYTKSLWAIKNFIEYNNLHNVEIIETKLNNLKSFRSANEIVICDDNISRIFVKKRIKRNLSKSLDLLLQIKPWDFIVHVDHWIWIFKQILEKELPAQKWQVIKKEYIELEYKNNDKLFVPITEVSRVNKYVWSESPKLTGLSTKEWEKKLSKAKGDIENIAWELLEVFAKRKLQKWYSFASYPAEEAKFSNSFEYTYTDDQLSIIREINEDMESSRPMDRLVSGDVWFWKTEIAFHAIYKALINNKQAALISPLIVLAYEHYEKARERFANFPFNIWVITRFEKPAIVKNTLEKLKNWKIDLIIWTHRLLSEDIQFKKLWVLIIDEEHKFWVKDKEKIKNFKWNIDMLSLSATPIPRSLNMALNGIKSMSMLTTPPVWRMPIETLVSKFDDNIIAEAWKREFERWWQLFFIHNRVGTIETMRDTLWKIFKNKKIIIAHGQLPWDALEKRILAFKRKEYDILLSTTVIENGIDFPNVNTIIINDAYNFWISQIHQLRWRVGRSDKKWHCYLLFNKDKIKEDAAKRLKTIVDYSHLWAWFELAVKDLEIRWGWDLLWIKQSGQSSEIWVNLFLEMLENKVEELKRTGLSVTGINQEEKNISRINTTIDLNISAFIPDYFFSSELDKINFYREIESLETLEDLENIISDFKEINKDIPNETNNFFSLLELKLLSSQYKIKHIKKVWINYQIDFDTEITLDKLKVFLKLDTDVKLEVTTIHRLRSKVKNYGSDYDFIKYTLDILKGKLKRKKIKLKKSL